MSTEEKNLKEPLVKVKKEKEDEDDTTSFENND